MKLKVKTTEQVRKGAVFHYTPFIFHVLFPEIVKDVYKYAEVIRERTVLQTIGFFRDIYTEVLQLKLTELDSEEYDKVQADMLHCEFTDEYHNRTSFDKFRNFIFNRYNIDSLNYNDSYPEVLLIKRYQRMDLLDKDLELQLPVNYADKQIDSTTNRTFVYHKGDTLYGDTTTAPWLLTNGRERREMDRVDDVERYLKNKFGYRFGSVYLELLPFSEQVKYFNNAKVIVCAHGGGMANTIFCKTGTKILEITCHKGFELFDLSSSVLELTHLKCDNNRYDDIVEFIESNV